MRAPGLVHAFDRRLGGVARDQVIVQRPRQVVALQGDIGLFHAQPRFDVSRVERVCHLLPLQRPAWPAAHHVDAAQRTLQAAVARCDVDHRFQVVLRGAQVTAVGAHHRQVEIGLVARPVRVRCLAVAPAPRRFLGAPCLQQVDGLFLLFAFQIGIGQLRMRGIARRVACHRRLQYRNGFLRVQGAHQRIADGGQHVVGRVWPSACSARASSRTCAWRPSRLSRISRSMRMRSGACEGGVPSPPR